MPRPKRTDAAGQRGMFDFQEQSRTAPCVPALRAAVKAWKAGGYKGTTAVTHELLNFWFKNDHRLANGASFCFHTAQQEAIETLIYVYEVEKARTRKDLLYKYAFQTKGLRLPPYDDFARYCIKMATGSGKTLVMAMAVAWQYANAVRENEKDYAKTFLIIAPNVIVFDRLRGDFESGTVFNQLPLVPKHFAWWWDLQFYMRGDSERAHSDGALYLTNIQQFYERPQKAQAEETPIMTQMLGNPPPTAKAETSDFEEQIGQREGLVLVLNDEAHHTHDEDSEWNVFIRRLHATKPVAAQLDFSATPRYSNGSLFAWTISDYPLKQAIVDGVVKRPIKGIAQIEEEKSDIASVRYAGFLVAGVERWKEYTEQLRLLKKKPVLFIMLNNTEEADDVGDWLRTKYPEHFGGDKTLIIHTNSSGDISKADLETARKAAREVDQDSSPVNAIVSVLMLREGWDVQNVTVVVGLRPYSSKAKILPEQTIGRGLRLMFRNQRGGSFVEKVDIIGNNAFLEFVEELEKLEDFKFDTFRVGKDTLQIVVIEPVAEKLAFDIGIPEMTPVIERKKSLAEEIAGLDVMAFEANPLPLKAKELAETRSFLYEGIDIITSQQVLEREYQIPTAQTAEEVIGYYARRIAQNIKLPAQFAALVPKIRDFFRYKAFGQTVELTDPLVVSAMRTHLTSYVVIKEFEKALRGLVVETKQPKLLTANRWLSTTQPFPTSKQVLEAHKTVFNLVPCDNELESRFAQFLNKAPDVKAFAKLPEQFGFCIQYTDTAANIRNYFPDFVAVLDDGTHVLIETKGREDIEVAMKDNAADQWCANATLLTQTTWKYVKVLQTTFEQLQAENLQDLMLYA